MKSQVIQPAPNNKQTPEKKLSADNVNHTSIDRQLNEFKTADDQNIGKGFVGFQSVEQNVDNQFKEFQTSPEIKFSELGSEIKLNEEFKGFETTFQVKSDEEFPGFNTNFQDIINPHETDLHNKNAFTQFKTENFKESIIVLQAEDQSK